MQQQTTEPTTVQTAPTTAQTGNTTVETGGTTVETGGTTVTTAEPTTLHDFTLGLLTDLDAREAFQQDPLGCLEAAGLSDITAADVQDILPLVLDAASVPNVDVADVLNGHELPAVDSLLQIAGNVEGVTGVADVAGVAGLAGTAPSALTALVSDFSGLGDVSGTLDSTLHTGTEAVSTVTEIAQPAVEGVVGQTVGLANVNGVTDVLVKDLDTDVLTKNVIDTDVLVKNTDVLVKDVADVHAVTNVTDNVVQDVAQVGNVHDNLHSDLGQVIGDVKVAGLEVLDGGVGNHNDIDIHL
jgi:hypothetical protein